jgi:fructose-1-phosphate kinase PfkB-like protein
VELAQRIEAYGIRLEAVWVGGVTRTAHVVSEIKHSRTSHLFSGELEFTHEQVEELRRLYRSHLSQAAWVICGGKVPEALPEDFFLPLVREAVEAGVPVLIDSFRAYLRSVITARPTVLKMNRKEFEWTFGEQAEGPDGLRAAAEKIYRAHALNTLLITCGEQGLLAVTPEGAFRAIPPRLKAVNTAGAGDAASAAIAWRRAGGDGWEETLRWAAAVSAAVVLTEGTADCRMEDIRDIFPRVQVLRLGG